MNIVKNVLVLLIAGVLSVSLACTSIAEEATPVLISADATTDFGGCEMCHPDVAENFATSLHYTGAGMKNEYAKYAAKEFEIDMDEYYSTWKCAKCHATTCDKCHVGYEAKMGHGDQAQEITIETCDPCHFKKQTSTFVGDMPMHKSEAPHADIHYEKGLICTDCHGAADLHGDGNTYASQLEAVKTTCEDCHSSPGKTVKGMTVTQYSTDVGAHAMHGDKLDCTACHTGWALTCTGCHLDTRKGTQFSADEFYLGVASDGKIKPFMKMETMYNNATHVGYGEWFSHTVTDKAKDCAFCHDNPEVFCEGCEGEILGKGGSFIPQERIDQLVSLLPPETEAPPPAEEAPPAEETPGSPGFGIITAFLGLFLVMFYLAKRR
ncbi:MAG: Cytochrome c7 c [Candidatus Argoarchaeum ethanivorans]|uniref:Cytochrome c7 c n=2 Tax=Candidatus Argoarchaeum ethanivorans TaxID=2608793 RepID=A0A811T8Y1_9EURY|nr:MAG: Cytochrome c7 c [Candidatus Argoarchaeum ethanivorans]